MPPNDSGEALHAHVPPEEGYELYRHRNASAMRARDWHGHYWARRNAAGDYEIRSVPSSLGEPSASGGVVPAEAFERLYVKADRV